MCVHTCTAVARLTLALAKLSCIELLVSDSVLILHADQILKTYGELDGKLHMVKLRVDPSVNLGLDLAGNLHQDTMSVFVAGIHPDSPAARNGQVHVGDELLEV